MLTPIYGGSYLHGDNTLGTQPQPPTPKSTTPDTLFREWYISVYDHEPSDSLTDDLKVKKAWMAGFVTGTQVGKKPGK